MAWTAVSPDRWRRRLAGLVGAVALVMTTAVGIGSPAGAAGTETPLDGVAGVGDVASGGGQVFVAGWDRVVVASADGTVTGTVGGLPGAVGLAVSPDGARLYVALSESAEVAEVDTGSLEVTRRISLGAHRCPTHLALSGVQLWIGYGCTGEWSGGVLTLDVSAPAPAVNGVLGGSYGAPVVAAAAGVLATGSTGLSPASFDVYTVDGAAVTRRGTVAGDVYNLTDLALTPDGSLVVAAFGYPYSHIGYDTTTLAEVRRYGDPSWGYPDAVAVSPDGAHLVAGRNGSPRLSVHTIGGATLGTAESSSGDLVHRAVTFHGPDVFAVLHDWQAGRFYLWRVAGATLPTSAIALTPPGPATALEPLAIAGRLTLSDGTAPGAQPLTVTRTLPDGTTAGLASVVTAADGGFTVTDTPPVAGDITYRVVWAGTATHQGSSAELTVPVASRSAVLTLTGPTTGEAGKRLRLTGTLSLDGRAPSPAARLAVYRTIFDNRLGGVTDQLADVVTDHRGAFRIEDTPNQGGRYVYQVRWAGAGGYGPAAASHEVSVSSTASQVTAVMTQPAYVGEPFLVGGGISFDVGECVGPTTVAVTRQFDGGSAQPLPDLSTDSSCSFQFIDVLSAPGPVRYTFTWAGDATHRGSTGTATGTVQKQPSYVEAVAEDYYLRTGQRVVITGEVAGARTGPLGVRLTLAVTRTDPDGSTTRLRDITTATDGTFTLRDSPPPADPSGYPAFTYQIAWAGTATYEGSEASVTVYLTPTG